MNRIQMDNNIAVELANDARRIARRRTTVQMVQDIEALSDGTVTIEQLADGSLPTGFMKAMTHEWCVRNAGQFEGPQYVASVIRAMQMIARTACEQGS